MMKFKPPFWHIVLRVFPFWVVALAISNILGRILVRVPLTVDSWLEIVEHTVAMALGFSIGNLLWAWASISIIDEQVVGQGFWRKNIIPIADIDLSKSRQQTALQRISGEYTIYSKNGSKIRVDSFSLSKIVTQKLFAEIENRQSKQNAGN
jgi:hypothetical protein